MTPARSAEATAEAASRYGLRAAAFTLPSPREHRARGGAEVLAVLRHEVSFGRLAQDRAGEAVDDLRDWGVERLAHRPLLCDAWSLRGHVSACDALYDAAARIPLHWPARKPILPPSLESEGSGSARTRRAGAATIPRAISQVLRPEGIP